MIFYVRTEENLVYYNKNTIMAWLYNILVVIGFQWNLAILKLYEGSNKYYNNDLIVNFKISMWFSKILTLQMFNV